MIKEQNTIITTSPFNYRSVKPEEIMAAGGTDLWAKKVGYSYQDILKGLENAPASDMTDEEWIAALEFLQKDK